MSKITIGRMLEDGEPVGDGIEIDEHGPTAEALRSSTGPLVSNPVTGLRGAALETSDDTDGEYSRGLGVLPPNVDGPPEHMHPEIEERFEVLEGEMVVTRDGRDRYLTAGDEVEIPPGTPHTFRNDSDEVASFVNEARPPGRLAEVVLTLAGLAHEGKVNDDGLPGPLQSAAMANELGDETVFTSVPPSVQDVVGSVLGPVANALGYEAVYSKYAEEEFWEERVEQPEL
ncbi:MAG: cupin domain-containing protein [Halobacteria archaeon]|nr:cupin domain-containing protein [Halobacteria archaeon]